jgi:hypothetical protein
VLLRLAVLLPVLIGLLFIGPANAPIGEISDRVRGFTRSIEFDFIEWTWNAAWLKLGQSALGAERYLDEEEQSEIVREFIALVAEIQRTEGELSILYANPDVQAVETQIDATIERLDAMLARRAESAPLAEGIMQSQVGAVATDIGLTTGGQTIPPLFFHSTPLPWALIVSPRNAIFQQANVSLQTELSLQEQIALEDQVAETLDVSTLVSPVGGVGTYPTMVAQSSSLNWLAEVISHEWTHNILTLHPLGVSYYESPELTTMNETTANIAGKEMGALVIERFYPELVPPPPQPASSTETTSSEETTPSPEPVFDFRAEMHATRNHVDELLAAGKVEEAESYMETRRLFFWDHGYAIRKLNQAYFAFYGSYADSPIGAAGEDPVGAAVRELRARSDSLEQFITRMMPLTSYQALLDLLHSLE